MVGSRLSITNVTRWLYYFSVFGHFHQWKSAQWHTKFVKIGLEVCQIQNKLSKNCQRLKRICQSGEISPNLVTLSITFPSTLIFPMFIVNNFLLLTRSRLVRKYLNTNKSLSSSSYGSATGGGSYQNILVPLEHCDQIRRFIAFSATFQSLWQQLFCPNRQHL